MLNTLNTFSGGWAGAYRISKLQSMLDAAKQGCNLRLVAVTQFIQTILFLEQVDLVNQITGRRALSGRTRTLLFVTPVVIRSISGVFGKSDNYLVKSIKWLNNVIDPIFHIASVVTTIALLTLGSSTYAAGALIAFGIYQLEKRHLLNLKVREIYRNIITPLCLFRELFMPNLLTRGLCAIQLIDEGIKFCTKKESIPFDNTISHLSFKQFEIIQRSQLSVNREHIHINPFPTSKDRQFSALDNLCDRFAWEKDENLSPLVSELEKDARWPLSEEAKKKGSQIQYLKRQLKHLTSSIRNECIETGEPLHYGVLKNYLGFISENLPLVSKEQQRILLMQLALSGGDYCGPGVYSQLESVAAALMNLKGKRLPLKQRILFLLQQERLQIMTGFHQVIASKGIYAAYGDMNDPHILNRTIQTLDNFGLPDQGGAQDEIAEIDYFNKHILRYFTGVYPEHLWTGTHECRGYDAARIVGVIQSQMGLLISNQEIYDWATEWIEHATNKESEKNTFLEHLMDGETFERNLRFRDSFIQAMLFDMGILTLPKKV